MKYRLLVLIMIIFLLSGCSNEISEEKKLYDNYVHILENENVYDEEIPFDIDVYVDKISDIEVMYRVIIDSPKEILKNIEAIAIHDKYTSHVFPSSGIFEKKYNLNPNLIDKDLNYVKGIILIGYIPYDGDMDSFSPTFKILFKYENELGELKQIIYSTKI